MTITQAPPERRQSSPASPARPAPPTTGLSPLALLALVQDYAAECAAVLSPAPQHLTNRSYELLELTGEWEIWAIHWPKDQGLEWHDHGGSSGALWVVGGALEEHALGADGLRVHRRLEVGGGTAFGPAYIHDVVNADDTPAVSLHAYSPPMASMTFYRQEGTALRVARAEYRADPSWAP